MSIRVTCTGCHTRFNVSEKFAGRQGPCPKCKQPIKIPEKSEEVQVHSPQEFGPKGLSGKAVLKPIFRTEAKISPVQLTMVAAIVIGFFAMALLIGSMVDDKPGFSWLLLSGMGILLAIPCVYAGYTFLRDSELGSLTGQDLWIRIMACAVLYGLSWLMFWVANYAMDDNYSSSSFVAVGFMFVIGSFAANLLLGLDLVVSILHFGLYFGCALLLRVIAGFGALPGSLKPADPTPIPEQAAAWLLENVSNFVSVMGL